MAANSAWLFGVAIWRGYLAWLFGVAIWRGHLAWLFGVAIWRGHLAGQRRQAGSCDDDL